MSMAWGAVKLISYAGMNHVQNVADPPRRDGDVFCLVTKLFCGAEAALDRRAKLPDEREAAARGEQGAREHEAVLHDLRRVLVAGEHRGAAVAFLVWLCAAAAAHERG